MKPADHFEIRPMEVAHPGRQNKRESSSDDFQRRLTGQNPCILHLMRLGYRYLSLKGATWDEETNIFPALFNDAIARINPDLGADDITRLLTDVKLLLDNEDLGKAFYDRLANAQALG
jgi:hypothetical protein